MTLEEDLAQYLVAYSPFLLVILGRQPGSRVLFTVALYSAFLIALNIYIYSRAHGREEAPFFWAYPLVLGIAETLYLLAPGLVPEGAGPVLQLLLLLAVVLALTPLPGDSSQATLLYTALVVASLYAGFLLAHYGLFLASVFALLTPLIEHGVLRAADRPTRLVHAGAHLSFILVLPPYYGLASLFSPVLPVYIASLLYLRAVVEPHERAYLLSLDLVVRGLLVILLISGAGLSTLEAALH